MDSLGVDWLHLPTPDYAAPRLRDVVTSVRFMLAQASPFSRVPNTLSLFLPAVLDSISPCSCLNLFCFSCLDLSAHFVSRSFPIVLVSISLQPHPRLPPCPRRRPPSCSPRRTGAQARAGRAVLVHCNAGRGRSAVVAIAFLLAWRRGDAAWTRHAAFEYVAARRR
jgi:hypothetical protein